MYMQFQACKRQQEQKKQKVPYDDDDYWWLNQWEPIEPCNR